MSKGGLGVTMSEFGNILLVWALVQSILPVFTGGLSDRYGYKETIAASTVTKIVGYLLMVLIPLTGYVVSTSAGDGIDMFGWFQVPALFGTRVQQGGVPELPRDLLPAPDLLMPKERNRVSAVQVLAEAMDDRAKRSMPSV